MIANCSSHRDVYKRQLEDLISQAEALNMEEVHAEAKKHQESHND